VHRDPEVPNPIAHFIIILIINT